MEKEVADKVVEYYSKYENKTSLFKTSNIQGSSFFLDEKYKVLDKSIIFNILELTFNHKNKKIIIKLDKDLME